MKIFRRIASALLGITIALSSVVLPAWAQDTKGLVIIHINDAHCGINPNDSTYGYADIAAYEAKLKSEGYDTLLVDAGDYVQGEVIGALSKGEYIIDIMNELDFDAATLGNHEFDYGMEQLKRLTDKAEFDILSTNFVELDTQKKVYDGWKIYEAGGVKVAIVGITTPYTTSSSSPSTFKNDKGEFIYGFCRTEGGTELYANVQESVDQARAAGADYVIALAHLGFFESEDAWSSTSVIKNTNGIDALIDGHSHSVAEGEIFLNKDGEEVMVSSTGTKLANIGTITISDGKLSASLVAKGEYQVTDDKNSDEYKAYASVKDYISAIEAEYTDLTNTVVAKSEVDLITNDPDNSEIRYSRIHETNLGNLVADAYRAILEADVAIANGGGIRDNIFKGDVTYGNIIAVQPFGNSLCLVEASGQEILDALEVSSMYSPSESGGFLQVSGMTYEIHNYIESSVELDENGQFVSVNGEYRVKNVKINGESIDLEKTYTLSSHNYIIKSGGDGYTMFMDNNLLVDEAVLDYQGFLTYITENLGGVIGAEYENLNGEDRITIFTEAPDSTDTEDKTPPDTSVEGISVVLGLAVIASAVIAVNLRKR